MNTFLKTAVEAGLFIAASLIASATPVLIVNKSAAAEKSDTAILLVEDHSPILNSLATALTRSGFTVCAAVNRRKAALLLKQHVFRLLITDIYMPEMDDFEVIMLLRASDPGIPVLAMTGGCFHTAPEDNLKTARILGSSGTIAKPFELPAFLATVTAMLAPQSTS